MELWQVNAEREDFINKNREVYYKHIKNDKRGFARFLSGYLTILMAFGGIQYSWKTYKDMKGFYPYEDLFFSNCKEVTLDMVKDNIYSSNKITAEEIDYLYNEQFFKDILPYVNMGKYYKYEFDGRVDDIKIDVYGDLDFIGRKISGYYSHYFRYHNLHINNKYYDEYKNDILAHEFVHMCQAPMKYNVICEACAEIMASEYFDRGPEWSYKTEIYLVKKLMEIIGTEPIMEYNFSGSFVSIENELKKYLTDEEVNKLKSVLKMRTRNDLLYNKEVENKNRGICNEMLDLLYERKFGGRSCDDPAIAHLTDPTLVRYYFNTSKKNQENSYYEENHDRAIYVEEAFNKRLIKVFGVYRGDALILVNDARGLKELGTFNKDDKFYILSDHELIPAVTDDGQAYVIIKNMEKIYIPPINEKLNEKTENSLITNTEEEKVKVKKIN